MNNKFSLFLICGWLWLLPTQAQPIPNNSFDSFATQAYWEHVESLKKRGVSGTSGKLIRYDSPEAELANTPFQGKTDGDIVHISGDSLVFYDIDFKNLSIIIKDGANVSFYNCKFGQSHGVPFAGHFAIDVQGRNTKLTLRFCDFEGPGSGQSVDAMLRADDILNRQPGNAALVDIAYCRTYGHASDGWKLARGMSKFSYFGPTVGSRKMPTIYQPGKTYQQGDYVVEDNNNGLYTQHIWRAWRATSESPRFDLVGSKASDLNIVGQQQQNGWVYSNPHADFFHAYASADQLTAEGHYINSSIADPHPDDAQGGIHQIGINNAIRYDNGDESLWNVNPPVFRGCYIVRDQERSSHVIDTGLPKPEEDRAFWRVEHLRTNAPPKGVITFSRSLFAFDSPKNLDGLASLEIFKHNGNADLYNQFYEVNEGYFTRNGRSAQPSLTVQNAYNIKPMKFAPAFNNQTNQRINAVIFLVNGQRVVDIKKQGNGTTTTYVHEDYRLSEEKPDGSYDLQHSNPNTKFHLVLWRGEAKLSQVSTSEPIDTESPGSFEVSMTDTVNFTVQWTIPTDNQEVVQFVILQDDQVLDTLSATTNSYILSEADNERSFTVTVVALDAAGNSSKASLIFTPSLPEEDTVEMEEVTNEIVQVAKLFSPNNDGMDDLWDVKVDKASGYKLTSVSIYNRYGQAVFTSNDSEVVWDGLFQGKPSATGAYYYAITYIGTQGQHTITGSLALVR